MSFELLTFRKYATHPVVKQVNFSLNSGVLLANTNLCFIAFPVPDMMSIKRDFLRLFVKRVNIVNANYTVLSQMLTRIIYVFPELITVMEAVQKDQIKRFAFILSEKLV